MKSHLPCTLSDSRFWPQCTIKQRRFSSHRQPSTWHVWTTCDTIHTHSRTWQKQTASVVWLQHQSTQLVDEVGQWLQWHAAVRDCSHQLCLLHHQSLFLFLSLCVSLYVCVCVIHSVCGSSRSVATVGCLPSDWLSDWMYIGSWNNGYTHKHTQTQTSNTHINYLIIIIIIMSSSSSNISGVMWDISSAQCVYSSVNFASVLVDSNWYQCHSAANR